MDRVVEEPPRPGSSGDFPRGATHGLLGGVNRSSSGKALVYTVLALVAVLGALALYTWGALEWSYADGERVGWVQKLSRKGWVCKTWEGELAMVSMPGAIPEKFYFSVRTGEVAEKINRSLGKRVSLIYSQHLGVPTRCFGETEYFVHDVKVVE
jgi:hypothetical protein